MNHGRFALGAVTLACAAVAQAAPHTGISDLADPSFTTAYLVDWDAATRRAHLTDYVGSGDGTWSDDGALRVRTLSAPIETPQDAVDCNGLPMTQPVDLLQLAVRHVSGGAHQDSAQVIEIGTTSDAGTTTPYADVADRPGMDDLAHGATLAGMSDSDPNADATARRCRATSSTAGSCWTSARSSPGLLR